MQSGSDKEKRKCKRCRSCLWYNDPTFICHCDRSKKIKKQAHKKAIEEGLRDAQEK